MNLSNDTISPGNSDADQADVTPLNSFDERVLSISPPRVRSKRRSGKRRPDNVGEASLSASINASSSSRTRVNDLKGCNAPALSNSGRFRMALYEAAVANNDGELTLSSEDETFSVEGLNGSTSGAGSSVNVPTGNRRDAMLTRARTQERDYKQRASCIASGGGAGGSGGSGPASSSCGGLDEFSIGGGGADDVTPDSDLEGDSAERRGSRPASFSTRTASFKRQSLARRNSGLSSSQVGSLGRAECTGERLRFHRDFTQLMRLALPSRREKEAANRTHASCDGNDVGHHVHHPVQQENDGMLALWFEMRCVLEECSMIELQTRIMQTRNRMPQLIDDVLQFRVCSVEDDSFAPRPTLPVTSLDGPTQDYVERVRLALSQVDDLMTQMDLLCDAWPSLHALELDYPGFADERVISRLKTMHLWKNITIDLNARMKLVAKVLCLTPPNINQHWHYVDVDKLSDVMEPPSNISLPRDPSVASCGGYQQMPSDSELSDNSGAFQGSGGESVSSGTGPPAKVVFSIDLNGPSPRCSSPNVPPPPPQPPSASGPSSHDAGDEIENVLRLYRSYADKSLKKLGVTRLLQHMRDILDQGLQNCRRALRRPPHTSRLFLPHIRSSSDLAASYADVVRDGGNASEDSTVVSSPSLVALIEGNSTSESKLKREPTTDENGAVEVSNEEELQLHGALCKDFNDMELPSFLPTYVFLARVPLDVLHACLRLRLQQTSHAAKPSFLSLGQLIRECKEVLRGAVLVKRYYKRMVTDVLNGDVTAEERLCEQNLEVFDEDVRHMLDVYFNFLQRWMTALQAFQEASRSYKNILEDEWAFMKRICHYIRGGEASAAKRFCNLASILLDSIGNFLQKSIDNQLGDLFDRTHPMVADSSEEEEAGSAQPEQAEVEGLSRVDGENSSLKNDDALNSSGVVDTSSCIEHELSPLKRPYPSERYQSFDSMRHVVTTSCKDVRHLFREARLRLAKAIGFAKMLRKDLEIAADFDYVRGDDEVEARRRLLMALQRTNHARVREVPGTEGHTLNFGAFVPRQMTNKVDTILHLLRTICARDASALGLGDSHHGPPFEQPDLGYLLLVEGCPPPKHFISGEGSCPESAADLWRGKEVMLPPQSSVEHTVVMSHCEVRGILLVVAHSNDLERQRQRFQDKMGAIVNLRNEYTACHQSIAEALTDLKQNAISLRDRVQDTIRELEEHLNSVAADAPDNEQVTVQKTCRETLHFCYPLGFEYHKELIRLLTGVDMKRAFIPGLLKFAYQWMDFVQSKCETGRGTLPRWSNAGCDFMISLALPCLLSLYSDTEFQQMKRRISDCITHLIGKRTASGSSGSSTQQTPSSPESAAHITPFGPQRATSMFDQRRKYSGQISFRSDPSTTGGTSSGTVLDADALSTMVHCLSSSSSVCISNNRRQRTMVLLNNLERKRAEMMTEARSIGRTVKFDKSHHLPHRLVKQVPFGWQRGFKLGSGQYGTVYTAVNLKTGDLMAMKEIRLQHNNHQGVKSLADEIETFTRLKHPCLVRYFGVELHREVMLVFMEYCDGGTLLEAARQGLEESLIRRYTQEIISGIHCLHDNSIVHRDIKSANIFLCKEGPLKVGDFGSSVKLRSTTIAQPSELCSMVGTIHYMAPEIITRAGSAGGYGRKSDIWSLGCVVYEMIVGKRPWAESESEHQIMYQVGMGNVPQLPPARKEAVSEEAIDFLTKCLVTDPAKRPLASELVDHPFAKVLDEDEDFTTPS